MWGIIYKTKSVVLKNSDYCGIMRLLNTRMAFFMYKFMQKMERFAKKLAFIIKNIVIPVSIALISCNIIAQWYGYDLNSFKIMQLLGFAGDKEYLLVLIIAFLVLWIVYDLFLRIAKRENASKNEYREYLVRELGEEAAKETSIDSLYNKKEELNVNERDEDCINSISSGTEIRKNEKKDIIALMLKNNDEITEYFKISKTQAKSSFWFSVISCIVGLLALVVGIYGIVILKDASISVISLISGAISELISGTVFWVHNKSALQLNHYYDALHENEKFLSAVNIADKLSDEKREEVLVEIIHKQISNEGSKTKTENINEKETK